jgi:hypothetical protein
MKEAAELAGLFAAHAVWCVADGETLIPFVGFRLQDGSTTMRRFVAERLEDGVAEAKQHLDANPDGATAGVLIHDGFITLPDGKTDALVLEVRSFGKDPQSYVSVVPYRHSQKPGGFAVHRPKFVKSTLSPTELASLGEAFFSGVDQHEKGSRIWAEHLDESR